MTSAVAPSAGITGPLVSPDAKRAAPEDGGAPLACRNALARRHPRMRLSTPSPLDSKPSSTRRGINGLGMSGLWLARGLQSSCPVEGQPAMNSRCERLRGASAAVAGAYASRLPSRAPVDPATMAQSSRRECSHREAAAIRTRREARLAGNSRGECSLRELAAMSQPAVTPRPSPNWGDVRQPRCPGPSPLEGGAHIGLWPPWATGARGRSLPRADRRILFCESFICEQRGRMATVRSALPDEQEDQRPSLPGQRGGARFTQGGASLPQGGAL